MTGWHRTERWLSVVSVVTAGAALLGWIGAVATGSGALSVLLLVLTFATVVFAIAWIVRPAALRWWSGPVVLVVVIGPAGLAFVILSGVIPHIAGLFTLVAVALAGATVVRRYEMPPIGR